ncbi:MAG: tRNA (guanosine(46)-N7)-methyltransferase TrmB [Mariprofundaceae bacterium]|nr:tRNA (guanosine(46)-N7)-methyltransferase TrmB [Mariprofundaceae bacterium]
MRLTREVRDTWLQHEQRSHGRKNGYVTKGQAERLDKWLPKISLHREDRVQDKIPRDVLLGVEIGFGNGEFLAELTQQYPEYYFVGVEIYLPGIAKAISRLDACDNIERVRVSQLPAQYVLAQQVEPNSVDMIHVNHPDPWPKKKHHHRRIIQKEFANVLASRLKLGGILSLASDIDELAIWMRDILDEVPDLVNEAGKGGFVPRPEGRIVTKFEERGMKAERISQFLRYRKVGANT